MVLKFLSATTILHPSPKQTRRARKSHRDQEALIASELQAQSDLAPFGFVDRYADDDDDDKTHPDSAHARDARKAAAACRTRGVKNWVRRLTHRPKRSPTHHPAPPTAPRSAGRKGKGSNADDRPHSLLALPGELQNLTITFLDPVALALLRLTCRHFHTIIPPPTFINPFPLSTSPLVAPADPWTPDPVRLLRCRRFAFLTALHPPPPSAPSPYLPRNWNVHAAVCGAPFYPCTGCKAFHHLEWFAPYEAAVRKFPSLANRPVDCRACVLHTFMPGEEAGLYSPEVWPGFAERWRGWRVARWWRCECCGRCVREVEVEREWEEDRARDVDAWVGSGVGVRPALEWESRSPGRYLMAVQGAARTVVGGRGGCLCGCDVCGMVGIDCWERGGRTVVLYRK